MFSEEGILSYMSATQEQLFENIKRQVEKLMEAEAPLVEENTNECVNTIGRHAFPHFSRQDEFEGIMLTFMDNQERQIQQLETHLKDTQNVFMELAEKFISRIKKKIREEAVKKISKRFLNSQSLVKQEAVGTMKHLSLWIQPRMTSIPISFLSKKRALTPIP